MNPMGPDEVNVLSTKGDEMPLELNKDLQNIQKEDQEEP
jgi:hypothetical protein